MPLSLTMRKVVWGVVLVLVLIFLWTYESNIEIGKIQNLTESTAFEISDFERELSSSYPTNNGSFYIRHPEGSAYFNWFKNLGDPVYYVLYRESGRIWATAIIVLREIPILTKAGDGTTLSSWYIADVKVHPDKRGLHLPYRMFCKAFWRLCLKCPRAYGITMLPSKALRSFGHSGFEPVQNLAIYLLPKAEFIANLTKFNIIEPHFRSNAGLKDIYLTLKNNQTTQNIYHLAHSKNNNSQKEDKSLDDLPEDSHIMFCQLDEETKHISDLNPIAKAAIVQYNLTEQDWSFIETAEI